MTTAMERVLARAVGAQDRKRQDWETLQRERPDVAAVLVAVREAFGRPEEVRVTWRAP
jgi:hypothetical protein